MATPTPSGKVVATPGSFSNLAVFSPMPAPRSVVASPLALFSKRSPANAATLQNSGSSQPHSFPLPFDSPTTLALGLNLVLPDLGGVAGSVTGRGDDEERRRRLETIIRLIGRTKGRVSEEGVERLAMRTGLEYLWQDGENGKRTLSIAGISVLIDVDFINNEVVNVALDFPMSRQEISTGAPHAGKILLKDLTSPPGTSSICTMLDPFAANLERLARMDKLGAGPELNCFEAISGIYLSLRRIFEFERQKLREPWADMRKTTGGVDEDEALDREVMCKKSGRARMHAGGRIGLSLEYWMDRRLVGNGEPSQLSNPQPASGAIDVEEPKIWSIMIECEKTPALMYPPARMSDNWVSGKVEKPTEEHDELFGPLETGLVDWLEPRQTFVHASSTDMPGADPMSIDLDPSSLRLPDVRFVARLEPPVVVPLQTAMSIFSMVGAPLSEDTLLRPMTVDSLILPQRVLSGDMTQAGDIREANWTRMLKVWDDEGQEEEVRHDYRLYIVKQDYGYSIEKIPFSHPRQLVEILPILRQYVLLTSLLLKCFVEPSAPPREVPKLYPEQNNLGTTNYNEDDDEDDSDDNDDEMIILCNIPSYKPSTIKPTAPPPPTKLKTLPIDLSLITHPTPKLTLSFPLHSQRDVEISIEILPQGVVHIDEQSVFPAGKDGVEPEAGASKRLQGSEGIQRLLEISEDFGVLVEFLRARVAL
ncbi:MAG: hypothetical protein M1829_005584 [Trizodia sp. TS-e1964]|nr:MAG: hypothetical protein M1829_005584 [Trizodia sp. TS-e1964]